LQAQIFNVRRSWAFGAGGDARETLSRNPESEEICALLALDDARFKRASPAAVDDRLSLEGLKTNNLQYISFASPKAFRHFGIYSF
jgi:hypothetical protein